MKTIIKRFSILLALTLIILGVNYSKATNMQLENEIEKYLKNTNIDTNNLTQEDVLDAYEKFSENFSADEIIDLIEENKDKIKEQGVRESTIEAGKTLLKTTDEEEIKEIIKENVKPEVIKEKIEKGYTTEQIIGDIIKEMPTEQKINTAGRIIFSNQIVKTIIGITIILFIYTTILRAIIYHKAGKNPIAAFIPFYRQITMYKICDLSLGYMFLWLVPIIGWIILFFIAIMKRIYLSQKFERGIGFGIGLIILPPIFQSIIAFNKNIKYVE